MSELLFLFGELDNRIRPFMFCIRQWAKTAGITYSHPGNWISNFGLTCLVIYYLQQLKEPILPSLNHLIARSRPEDTRILDSKKFAFLRDGNQLDFNATNTKTLQELLLDFLEFYSKFDFNNNGLSMHTASTVDKSELTPMFIVNPIEPHLNVTKNVSQRECERLQISMRMACQAFEEEISKGSVKSRESWGILNLFREINTFRLPADQMAIGNNNDAAAMNLARKVIRFSAKEDVNTLMNVQKLYTRTGYSVLGPNANQLAEEKDDSKKKLMKDYVARLMVSLKDKQNKEQAVNSSNNVASPISNTNKQRKENRKRSRNASNPIKTKK